MVVRNFKELKSANETVERIQSNIALFANSVSSIELLDGRLIEDVALTSSETSVEHKLGRDYRGWIIVNKNAQQDVWVSSITRKESFLKLTAAGTVTVSLWVF